MGVSSSSVACVTHGAGGLLHELVVCVVELCISEVFIAFYKEAMAAIDITRDASLLCAAEVLVELFEGTINMLIGEEVCEGTKFEGTKVGVEIVMLCGHVDQALKHG